MWEEIIFCLRNKKLTGAPGDSSESCSFDCSVSLGNQTEREWLCEMMHERECAESVWLTAAALIENQTQFKHIQECKCGETAPQCEFEGPLCLLQAPVLNMTSARRRPSGDPEMCEQFLHHACCRLVSIQKWGRQNTPVNIIRQKTRMRNEAEARSTEKRVVISGRSREASKTSRKYSEGRTGQTWRELINTSGGRCSCDGLWETTALVQSETFTIYGSYWTFQTRPCLEKSWWHKMKVNDTFLELCYLNSLRENDTTLEFSFLLDVLGPNVRWFFVSLSNGWKSSWHSSHTMS